MQLQPHRTIDEFYGSDVLFAPRVSWRWNRWSVAPEYRDFLTGLALPIAGSTLLFCAAGCVRPRMLDRIGDLLPPIPAGVRTYDDHAGWTAGIERARSEGLRIATGHVHAPGELPESAYAVPRDLLILLGDKGRLGELVEAGLMPVRRVASLEEAARTPLPAVLKAIDEESVSGGSGVRLCTTRTELEGALALFAGLRSVVIEELLDPVRTDCIHFGIHPDGRVSYLGTAVQVTVGHRFAGNVVGLDEPSRPAVDAAAAVARQAAALGYSGLAGIDAAILRDGAVRVLDLNFRINSSTPAVLLRSPGDDRGLRGTSTTLVFRGEFESFVAATRRVVEGGARLVSAFDPMGEAEAPFVLRAIVPGDTRAAINQALTEVQAAGFASTVELV